MERYFIDIDLFSPCPELRIVEDPKGYWVKYADAQATIAALEQRIQELQDKVGECAKVPVTFDPYW